ncbi:MAG: type VI secretion system baseplate subunit TssE [Zoogloea sp.]|nr:type VI secretion system baseplate subunit TssE [Zoogloea sp.]
MLPELRRNLHQPSVLDRLLDDHPDQQDEMPVLMDLFRLKKSVARDLEALLNSRNSDLDGNIESHPLARDSMLSYGIIDLSSLSLLDPGDRAYLRDKIRITLERHEPRLDRIRVKLEAPEGNERMLHFRVDAVLRTYPTKPPVSFDARLRLSANAYQIREK